MLHNLRLVVNNDVKWRAILCGLNKTFYHQTVTTKQIEDYLSQQVGMEMNSFFNQYLRDIRIPLLEYIIQENILKYCWTNTVSGFEIPVRVSINRTEVTLNPKLELTEFNNPSKIEKIVVNPNYYIFNKEIQK